MSNVAVELSEPGAAGRDVVEACKSELRGVFLQLTRDLGASSPEVLADGLILVIEGGRVKWVFNTSTGNGERYWSSASGRYLYATTPSGRFAFQRAIDGMRRAPLGNLWRPRYFNGGIAIHGSPSIPGYPASHGCARLDNKAIDYIWSANLAPIGSRVWVY